MQSVIPLKEHRKFNDAGAAILFAIFLLTVNTIVFLTFLIGNDTKVEPLIIMETGPKHSREMQFSDILIPAVSNILLLITDIAITLVSLVYFPRACIYISLGIAALLPLLYILSIGMVGVIIGLVSLIAVLLIYHFLIRPYMNYIVAMLHASAVILSQYIFKIMGIFTLVNIILLVQIVCVSFALFHNGVNKFLRFLLFPSILLICWFGLNAFYFIQVFVSGIIYGHINRCQQPENSIVKNSLVYSAYAFGSICFGSPILGVFRPTFSLIFFGAERNNRRKRKQEKVSAIIAIKNIMLGHLLVLIDFIVSRINNIVFPYIALYGTDYQESATLSFGKIRSDDFGGVSALLAIDYALGFFFVAAMAPIIIANIIIQGYSKASGGLCAYITLCSLLAGVLYYRVLSMISNGVLSLVFTRIEFSKAIDSYNPELGKIIDVENKEGYQTN
ncbi:hypothetical protein PAEPH01_1917 [Pancytospora epiphaga]|nr:hypothetical protein PAEPH01_1917 [Pancytospora epiphaga]